MRREHDARGHLRQRAGHGAGVDDVQRRDERARPPRAQVARQRERLRRDDGAARREVDEPHAGRHLADELPDGAGDDEVGRDAPLGEASREPEHDDLGAAAVQRGQEDGELGATALRRHHSRGDCTVGTQ
jgi:hypothetical protein